MDQVIENLRAIVGRDAVLADADELLVYECDGLPQHKYRPRAVVFPTSTEAVSAVMKLLSREKIPFTPRGAGTGLSGGALTLTQGVVIEMARMRQILKIDPLNRFAVVQPGVVNAHVSRAAAPYGLHYVPDPSSNSTCTIGGNIAENAGGIHCLKYGTTTDHVLRVRAVLSDGEIIELGGGAADQPGYDLLGTFIGSEGTFGIVTEATLRLVPIPAAIRTLLADFLDVNDASHAVSAIIAAGVMPAALEMMDHAIIQAVEASVFAAGLPKDADAALLIELDGLEAGIDDEAERVKKICVEHGARSCRLARDENERKKLWAARKGAFGAIGRIAPDSMIQDAVVPRSRLPEVLAHVYRIAAKYNLRIANVFHAGDGNLHPLICFDSRSPAEVMHVKDAGRELMEICVQAGGTISGEHGVGFDKRELLPLIFSDADMTAMLCVRSAFDPQGLMNPGKIIPMLRGCGEGRAAATFSINGNGTERGTGVSPVIAPVNSNVRVQPKPSLPSIEHGRDARATPGTIAEVCDVIREAGEKHLAMVPAGGETWISTGDPLSRNDLVIRTTKLNRIIEHEPADLIASAEAGVRLLDFNGELSKRGQWLPVDPPDDGTSTLGGVVATGLMGPQRIGYGSPRTFVIGMKVVLADGILIKAGGRVVKNVAGYDLCKLFTGSYGTLGMITELTFKLRPLPQESQTIAALGSAVELLKGAQKVVAANLLPVAVELLSPSFVAAAGFSDDSQSVLLVRFSGLSRTVAHQALSASGLLEPHSVHVGPLEDDEPQVWQTLSAMPFQFSNSAMLRASVPPSSLQQFLNAINKNCPAALWQSGAAEGKVRVIIDPGIEAGNHLQILEGLRRQAESSGGSMIIESLPEPIKGKIGAWGNPGSRGQLMTRVKQQLDPQGLFSPNRFGVSSSAHSVA